MKNSRVKKITRIAVLSAIAFVLQMLGSLVPKIVFLEIEFSDLPALIAAFAMGPMAGVLVELIKNLLHSFSTSTGLVGELANFTVNGIFVFTAGMIYKHNRTHRGALISMLVAVITMTLAAIAVNLFIMLPLYLPPSTTFAEKMHLVATLITPFNLVRGLVISLITYLCYKKLKPLLV